MQLQMHQDDKNAFLKFQFDTSPKLTFTPLPHKLYFACDIELKRFFEKFEREVEMYFHFTDIYNMLWISELG